LFSRRFDVRYHVPDKKHCALGLAAGVGMGPRVFFKILGVHATGELTVVTARANGAPGAIVLLKGRRHAQDPLRRFLKRRRSRL